MFFGIQLCFSCCGMKSPTGKKNTLGHFHILGCSGKQKDYTVPVAGFFIFTVFCMQRDGTKINGCRWLTQDFRKQTAFTQCITHLPCRWSLVSRSCWNHSKGLLVKLALRLKLLRSLVEPNLKNIISPSSFSRICDQGVISVFTFIFIWVGSVS